MNKKNFLMIGFAALMLASCSDSTLTDSEEIVNPPVVEETQSANTAKMQLISGASQSDRIETVVSSRVPKSQRLQYVATILPAEEKEDYIWSATSVLVNPDRQEVYVTWHSDRQATTQATAWGGAIDVVNITDEDHPSISVTGISDSLKFNHVLLANNNLYLSGSSAITGGMVTRIPVSSMTTSGVLNADCIGFPGSSVNSVAEYGNGLIAVSGRYGTWGTFAKDAKATIYDQDATDNVVTIGQDLDENYGGKYVTVDNGIAYVLSQPTSETANAQVQVISGGSVANTIELDVALTSSKKAAESFSYSTKDWYVDENDTHTYYGKHVLAVKNGYLYVAAGNNGLRVYNASTGALTWSNNTSTIGVYADETFLYAATGAGLRMYTTKDDGTLALYAFEVETYNEDGTPASTTAATTGASTSYRHSPNFVAVNPESGYIYIAYGQSGVRVYKFNKEEEEEEDEHGYVDIGDDEIVWADENLEGYFAWGEIFTAAADYEEPDAENASFTYNGTTYSNNDTYYTGYTKTYKTTYTWETYRYFNNSATLTKYTFDGDGKTQLDPEDDAAAVRWGDGWRMPTIEEWERMMKLCKKQLAKDTETGMKYLVFTSTKTEETLLFPAAGYYSYNGGQLKCYNDSYASDGFYYWSSTLSDQDNTGKGPGGYISGGDLKNARCEDSWAWMPDIYYGSKNAYDRADGFKVRPVKDKSLIPEFQNN